MFSAVVQRSVSMGGDGDGESVTRPAGMREGQEGAWGSPCISFTSTVSPMHAAASMRFSGNNLTFYVVQKRQL